MEELLDQISTGITRVQNEPLWVSMIGLEYAYLQLKLSEEVSRQCNFAITGGNMNGYYRFEKELHCLSDIPTMLQEKIDRKLNYQTPVWLDDVTIVTREDKEKQEKIVDNSRETPRSRIRSQ